MSQLVQSLSSGECRQYMIGDQELIIGRLNGLPVVLEGANVSRRHARIWREGNGCFLEDMGSSNGTFVNDNRITCKTRLHHNDRIRIGSHHIRFEDSSASENEMTIMHQTAAVASNPEIYRESPAQKLQAILELAHHLANSLNREAILARLLEHLLVLFPQADRAIVLCQVAKEPRVMDMRVRQEKVCGQMGFSRSVARKVFENGLAVLAEDTQHMDSNVSIGTLGIHSLLAVPLQAGNGPVLGVLELDRFQMGRPFTAEDLNLLTAIALQASTVLENAMLHEELVVKERIQRELALAQEIQQGFLPRMVPGPAGGMVDLYGELQPAQEIAGDFYDYLTLDSKRLMLAVGDVSGKGMPAALFMAMVRTLLRDLVQNVMSPAEILARLNDAIVRDNPKFMFVTLLLGIYDLTSGRCILARAGHPPAMIRRKDGSTFEIDSPPGRLLGIESPCPGLCDQIVNLESGDAIIFYTDGLTEAVKANADEMYGMNRTRQFLAQLPLAEPLMEWARLIRQEVEEFSKSSHLQDDLTLLLLRRSLPS